MPKQILDFFKGLYLADAACMHSKEYLIKLKGTKLIQTSITKL